MFGVSLGRGLYFTPHASFSQEFFLHIQCFFCGIESVALTTPQFLIRESLLHAHASLSGQFLLHAQC